MRPQPPQLLRARLILSTALVLVVCIAYVSHQRALAFSPRVPIEEPARARLASPLPSINLSYDLATPLFPKALPASTMPEAPSSSAFLIFLGTALILLVQLLRRARI